MAFPLWRAGKAWVGLLPQFAGLPLNWKSRETNLQMTVCLPGVAVLLVAAGLGPDPAKEGSGRSKEPFLMAVVQCARPVSPA